MLRALTRNWWMVLLQGLLTIAFGIAAVAWPGLTLQVLLTLLAIYLLIEGISALIAAVRGGKGLWYVISGAVSILAGIFVFLRPGITAVALLVIIGLWALVKGLMEVVAAVQLRKEIQGEVWLILAGIVTALFGVFALLRPAQGALAILWVIGLFAMLRGLMLTLLSFKLKGVQERFADIRGA